MPETAKMCNPGSKKCKIGKHLMPETAKTCNPGNPKVRKQVNLMPETAKTYNPGNQKHKKRKNNAEIKALSVVRKEKNKDMRCLC
ncbi:MAG: hypothetical protein KBT19_02845 [Lachnospiraceae bacterium]|nr:hypothetical protein [Candidatus Colinaster equi]